MTVLDLFSGIGGFRNGLTKSGHKCIGHVEIDKYANLSYCVMYNLVPCKYRQDTRSNTGMVCNPEVNKSCDGKDCKGEWYAKDIKRIREGEIPKAEIWTFGFPCTDISVAGKHAGLRGERSGLFFTVIGLLKSLRPEDRPKQLLIENVKHLIASERGGAFTTVLFELWEAGYDCEWQIVNSKDFGVPQSRERVLLVGHLGNRGGRKVFPIGGSNKTPVKQIIGGMQGKRVYDPSGIGITMTANGGGKGGRTGLYCMCMGCDACMQPDDDSGKSEVVCFIDLTTRPKLTEHARCLLGRYNAGVTNRIGENSGVFICTQPLCARAVLTPDRMEKRQNGRRVKDCGEPMFTLTTQDRHGVMLCGCKLCEGLPVREATQMGYTTAFPGDSINFALCGRIRRLTPRECWRLQAFEDDLFEKAAAVCSDSQLYKQAGNAVTVSVIYEIGLKL